MAEPFTTYKLIVLYMAKHSKETLTNSQISEFILDRDYTDYFQLQKVLSELVETELLRKRTISNSSYYEITVVMKNSARESATNMPTIIQITMSNSNIFLQRLKVLISMNQVILATKKR